MSFPGGISPEQLREIEEEARILEENARELEQRANDAERREERLQDKLKDIEKIIGTKGDNTP